MMEIRSELDRQIYLCVCESSVYLILEKVLFSNASSNNAHFFYYQVAKPCSSWTTGFTANI